MDQEDLYVYQTNPGRRASTATRAAGSRWKPSPNRSRCNGEATPRTVTIDLRATARCSTPTPGPSAPGCCAPPGWTTAWRRISGRWTTCARNWDQFRAAMSRWGAPGEDQVYADTSRQYRLDSGRPDREPAQLGRPDAGARRWPLRVGRLSQHGRTAVALQPGRRATWSPPTRNNIPANHPAAKIGVGYEWSDSSRAQRQGGGGGQVAQFGGGLDGVAERHGVPAGPARGGAAQAAQQPDAQVQRGLDLLRNWDGNERQQRGGGAVRGLVQPAPAHGHRARGAVAGSGRSWWARAMPPG